MRGYPLEAHLLSSRLIIGADSIDAIGAFGRIRRVGREKVEPC